MFRMNENTRSSSKPALERLMHALAQDECRLEAPSRVHAAVMQAWDLAHHPLPSPVRRPVSMYAAFAGLGSVAALLTLVATLVQQELPSDPGATTAGVVLVADPILDTSTTTLVRVRVPRSTLVTLGIAPLEPDEAGSVDLEMLVGEDGVAQVIHRAVPVAGGQE
jgi:hypothetical protein